MSFPESLSPHGDAAAPPLGPLPGSFTGQAKDFPGPQESNPGPPEFLLSALPAASPATGPVPVPLPTAGESAPPTTSADPVAPDLLFPESSVMPHDTAIRLQQLTAALLQPPAAPMAAPKSPAPGVSLSALADHLNARFLQPDAPELGSADLLSTPPEPGGSFLPPPAPAPQKSIPSSLPMQPMPLTQLAAALSVPGIPGVSPAPLTSPASIRAVVGALSGAPKPSSLHRQGDVFFADPPEAPANPAEPSVETKPGGSSRKEAPPPAKPAARFPGISPTAGPAGPPPLPSGKAAAAAIPPGSLADPRGTGLLLGGAGLILLGIFLACRLPLLWLELDGSDPWTRQKTEAALILQGAGALFALSLGTGSMMLRRWAPPLILATGWLTIFTSVLLLGVAGMLLGSEAEPQTQGADGFWLVASLLVSLAYLFYYEKHTAAEVCAASDSSPSWTDHQTVPSLMVLLSGLTIAMAAGAMLRHQLAFPLPPDKILAGPPAQAVWAGLLATGLLTALCTWHRRAAANGLLLFAALGLAGTIGVCGCTGLPAWESFLAALGRPAEGGPPSSLVPLAAGLAPALLFLVLLMARRAFASPPPP